MKELHQRLIFTHFLLYISQSLTLLSFWKYFSTFLSLSLTSYFLIPLLPSFICPYYIFHLPHTSLPHVSTTPRNNFYSLPTPLVLFTLTFCQSFQSLLVSPHTSLFPKLAHFHQPLSTDIIPSFPTACTKFHFHLD